MTIGMFFGGIIIGFIWGWLFTLVILGSSPVMLIGLIFFAKSENKS